jgi:RNA polymerase sigma factor (sigma-70 family)
MEVMEVQEDRELIEEILHGSQAAMEVLVNRYYKMIFAYIYRGIGQYHTSYDLTQEVFIKMMKAVGKFNGEAGSFKNWIFKIAVNTVKDYFKGREYKGYTEAIEINNGKWDEEDNVVEFASRISQREEIKNAVMQLPDFQRDTIILRFYHDMKIKDIARITDSSESTVKSRLRQGIEKLKDILKEGEENEAKGIKV